MANPVISRFTSKIEFPRAAWISLAACLAIGLSACASMVTAESPMKRGTLTQQSIPFKPLVSIGSNFWGDYPKVCRVAQSEKEWNDLGLAKEFTLRGLPADSLLKSIDFSKESVLGITTDSRIGYSLRLDSMIGGASGTHLFLTEKQPDAGTPQFGITAVFVQFFVVSKNPIPLPFHLQINDKAAPTPPESITAKTGKPTQLNFKLISPGEYYQSVNPDPGVYGEEVVGSPPKCYWIRSEAGWKRAGYKQQAPITDHPTPEEMAVRNIDFSRE